MVILNTSKSSSETEAQETNKMGKKKVEKFDYMVRAVLLHNINCGCSMMASYQRFSEHEPYLNI